jgi:OOP family OmpA-OmpF porin
MIIRCLAFCLTFAFLGPVIAFAVSHELSLPTGARQLADRVRTLDSYMLPVGGYAPDGIPGRMFEGRVERQSWRIGGVATTLQVLAPLRDQISAAGYEVVFECENFACGGFDFRFGIEVIPAPDMHVDIRNYRYLAAVRGDSEALSLLVSRASSAAYIQIIHTSAPVQARLYISPQDRPDLPVRLVQPDGLAQTLQTDGHVVLADLEFATGAARLEQRSFASLDQLSDFLAANPGFKIALVGHTDSIGSLIDNISLSKRRAVAVRARLVDHYGIALDRIEAEGMGYLAPVASNLTREGRDANRRVEAILLSE